MTYAGSRSINDADSHLMEGFTWLANHADATTKALLPDIDTILGKGGAGAADRIAEGESRVGDPEATAHLEDDVIASAKGWGALGAMDGTERRRALDLLGFESQLVFSTFSVGLFAFSDDPALVYGGAAAHNRMVAAFCADDPRLVPVGFLPLNDPEPSLAVLHEAMELGCGALWVAHHAAAGRSPAHTANEPIWAAASEAEIPIVLHVGGGKSGMSRPWHDNGLPLPPDIHGGGENLRAKDFPVLHHAPETYLTCLVLDGVLERHPGLQVAAIELGATWVPGLMDRLDHAARSFGRKEQLLQELPLRPSDYVRRQVKFTPFPGEDVGKLIAQTGPELYLFSSDYPHPEGGRDPIGAYERSLDRHRIDESARRRFYSDNYRQLIHT